ncbi:beta strand repeat-containing protein [Lutimaribacter marinistellae]|uniref:Beta strand repeat-containing protein n=1 Tax=Lutimaribacter marinistellae TaxID=1820329 RepID=A0ABV7TME2_9RHOB
MALFVVSATGLTLNQAVAAANSDSSEAHTIRFDDSMKGVTLTNFTAMRLSGDITIDGDIDGDDRADVTLDGRYRSSAFVIDGTGTVVIESLNFTQATNAFGGPSAIEVLAGGDLTVRHSTFFDTAATNGGAIDNAGTLQVEGSLFKNNFTVRGGEGGAIRNQEGATLEVKGSTFWGNVSEGPGGAIYNAGQATIIDSTITGNDDRSGVGGGGIANASAGTLNLSGNLIISNEGTTPTESNVSGTFTETGPNLLTLVGSSLGQVFEGTTSTSGVPTGILADNGGPVQTVALNTNAGNPALDANTSSELTDGRGAIRGVDLTGINNGGVADLGAFEAGIPVVTVTATTSQTEAAASSVPAFTLSLPALSGTDTPAGTSTRVHFSISGTAERGTDYSVTLGGPAQVQAEGGDRFSAVVAYGGSAVISVGVVNDPLAEGDESIVLSLEPPTPSASPSNAGYLVGSTNVATYVIGDDDPIPALSISSAQTALSEGGVDLTVTISVDGGVPPSLPPVALVQVPSTGDFADPVAKTVTFAQGATSATGIFTVADDVIVEPLETFAVELVAPTIDNGGARYTLGTTSTFDVTVADNDADLLFTVGLSAGKTVSEGATGSDAALATVFLTDGGGVAKAAPAGGLTVSYTATFNGPFAAARPDDFVPLSGRLFIPEGETQGDILISSLDDIIVEGDVSFDIALSPASVRGANGNYDVDPAAATAMATLADNDTLKAIVTAVDVTTDETGTTAEATVRLTAEVPDGRIYVVAFSSDDTSEVTVATPFTEPAGAVGGGTADFIDLMLEFGTVSPEAAAVLPASAATANNLIVFRPNEGDNEGLIFSDTNGDFDVLKTARFQGQDDALADGTQFAGITATIVEFNAFSFGVNVVGSVDLFGTDGSPVTDIQVANVDDDSPGVLVSDVTGSVSEADLAQTATYQIRLATDPGGTVTIDLAPDADVEVSTDGATFASAGQITLSDTTAQTITVRAVDDGDVEGTLGALISHAISSGTTDYPTSLNILDATVRVVDDDTPSATLGTASAASEESLISAFVPIILSAPAPVGGLTVAYTVSGATTSSVQTATPGTDFFNLPGTIFIPAGVTGANLEITPLFDDFDEQPFEELTITLDTGTNYQLGSKTSERVSIFDDDQAGFLVLESGATTIIPEGSSDSYTIQLTSRPTADVTVMVNAGGNVQPTSATQSLTFSSANWDTPQTVILELGNDDIPGSNGGLEQITHSVASSDPDYDPTAVFPVIPRTVDVQTVDGDVAQIVFVNDGIFLSEDGSTANDSYSITLLAAPTADVIISAQVLSPTPAPQFALTPSNNDGNGNLVLNAGTLSGNFTVARIEDDVDYTNLSPSDFQIAHTVTSADPNFDGLNLPTIPEITLTQDDAAGFTVTPLDSADTTVVEGEADSDGFTVQLDSEPQSEVRIQLDSAWPTATDAGALNIDVDGAARGTATELVFNASNWNTPQTVTLSKVVSDDIAGEPFTVDLIKGFTTVSPEYVGLSAPSLSVDVVEDDVEGLTITETGGGTQVVEGGSNDSFDIVLDSQPTETVTIRVTGDTGQFEPIADLLFTPETWDIPQTVALTALEDADVGDATYTLGIDAISADPKYDVLSDSLAVTVEELANRAELADGLSTALTDIATTVNSTLNLELPLFDVGAVLPDFFETFTSVLVDIVRNDQSGSIAALGAAMANGIETAFSTAGITLDATVTPTISLGEVAFDITLGNEYATSLPLSADFGVPAVGFNVEGTIDPSFNYQLALGFGISEEQGFFLDTATTGFTASVGASLNDSFAASGNIGFLGIEATNRTDDEGDSLTGASVNLGLALNDLDGNDGTSRVAIDDFAAASPSDVFGLSFDASASLGLAVNTTLGANAVLPSFGFDLDGTWTALELNDQGVFEIGAAPTLAFNTIQVDTGEFLTNFADPVFRRIDAIIDPLRPVIDILQTDIVVFDRLGIDRIRGTTIDSNGDGSDSLVEVLEAFGGGTTRVSGFVNAIDNIAQLSADIIDLLDDADANGTNIIIDLGSFELGLSDENFDADPNDPDFDDAKSGVQNGSTSSGTGQVGSQIDNSTTLSSKAKALFNNLRGNEFLSFPLLTDAESVFDLLTGTTDVSLFEFDVPALEVGASFGVGFNVFGVLKGDLGVNASILADFAFGFDTQGFFDWASFDFLPSESWRIFDGLFVSDVDENGEDVPEIVATLDFSGGVEANLWVAKGYVRAGVEGTATVDFRDTGEASGTGDGKIRAISEIGANLATPWNLFNLAGAISAYAAGEARAFGVKLGSFSVSKELIRIEYGADGLSISTVFDGPIIGGVAFFDANFSGVRDPDEPFTITGADPNNPDIGLFDLAVPLEVYDHNGNGVIDPNEGRIIVLDGYDLDTGDIQVIPYVTAAGWTVASPLTLLAIELAPIDPAAVETSLESALGLPAAFDLRGGDPLAGILAGNSDAAEVFKVLAQLQNLIILGANTLGDANDPTPGELISGNFNASGPDFREEGAIALVNALATLVKAGTSIDLSDGARLTALIETAGLAIGQTPVGLGAAVADLVFRNTTIAGVSGTGVAARDAIADEIAFEQSDTSYGYTLENVFARLLGASVPKPSVDTAAAQVEAALGLGIDISSFDTIGELQNGNADALDVYAKQVAVNATLVQLAELSNGASGGGSEPAALAALVGEVSGASTPLDLTDPALIEALITEIGAGVSPEATQKAAQVIAGSNREMFDIAENAGPNPDLSALRQQIAEVQTKAQGGQAGLLGELGGGKIDESEFDERLVLVQEAPDVGVFEIDTDEETVAIQNIFDGIDADVLDAITIAEIADLQDAQGTPLNPVTGTSITLASGALVTLLPNGQLTYDPNGAFDALNNGERSLDAFKILFQTADGSFDGRVAVTIDGLDGVSNIAPVAADIARVVEYNRTTTIRLDTTALNIDGDNGSPLVTDADGDTISLLSIDLAGVVSDAGAAVSSEGIVLNPTGTFAYLAGDETASLGTATYTVSDGNGGEDTGEIALSITGDDDLFNTGGRFSFVMNTNGGANRFGFDGDDFFVQGKDVRGREKFNEFDDLLTRSAELFSGEIIAAGIIDDQALPSGNGPQSDVTGANTVVISGSGIDGIYEIQFDKARQADRFDSFFERMLTRIDDKDVVANDATDFRFDIGDLRIFFDDDVFEYGLTTDGGQSQGRFGDLERFVEAIAEEFGGVQLYDGRFAPQRIADGREPWVANFFHDDVVIFGANVRGVFRFDFEDRETARMVEQGFEDLFEAISSNGIVAVDDAPLS